ncbi:hypothetical protein TrRE_jg952 [Triparma retinervis]|uniref:Phosphodiesterase n=1 Tax=Triparma retinervis TaxID=2557542 RepID=A0A9W6ZL75_9STRA|nr:hypothetical protein TrRE_jg952 [Triparma retinervis]
MSANLGRRYSRRKSVKKKLSIDYSTFSEHHADHESDPLFETSTNVYDLLTQDVDKVASDRMTEAEKHYRKMSTGPRRFSTLAREQFDLSKLKLDRGPEREMQIAKSTVNTQRRSSTLQSMQVDGKFQKFLQAHKAMNQKSFAVAEEEGKESNSDQSDSDTEDDDNDDDNLNWVKDTVCLDDAQTARSWSISTILFDHVVPHLTWFLMFALIKSPLSMRPLWFAIYFFPALAPRSFSSALHKLLRSPKIWNTIAKDKNIQILVPPPLEQSRDAVSMADHIPRVYGLHPHNKYPMNIFPGILSSTDKLPNLKVAQSSLGKWVPTVGWTTWFAGNVVDVTKKAIERELLKHNDIALFPGGAREMIVCEPDSDNICMVKHAGFLRLARANGAIVVPTFWFGMNDSHVSIFGKFDSTMYKKTGASIPLWLPNLRYSADSGVIGVVGPDIDTHEFTSDLDLEMFYFDILEELFEKYKVSVGGKRYANRTLKWVEHKPKSKAQERKPPTTKESAGEVTKQLKADKAKKVKALSSKIAGMVGPIFISLVLGTYLVTRGTWWSFSTWEAYEKVEESSAASDKLSFLYIHLTSCAVWAVLSFILITTPFRKISRWHRKVGTVAVIASLVMSWSAVSLSCQSLLEHKGSWNVVNKGFHAICNFQIAYITVYLVAYGVSSIFLYKKRAEHSKVMVILFMNLAVALVPRFSAAFFRWLGAAFWSNDTSFSLACLTQIVWQVGQIIASKRNATKTKTSGVNKENRSCPDALSETRTWNVKKLVVNCNIKMLKFGLFMVAITLTDVFEGILGVSMLASCIVIFVSGALDSRRDFAFDAKLSKTRIFAYDDKVNTCKAKFEVSEEDDASYLQHWYYDVHQHTDAELYTALIDMFKDRGLLKAFEISEEKLLAFAKEVIKGYTDAPYHNKYHAFDVMHVSYLLLTTCKAGDFLKKIDELCLLVSALAHDVGHDGFNNEFHKKTMSEKAQTYAGHSIQEMNSASMLFRIMEKPEFNFLENLSADERSDARDKMVRMILDTDPTRHYDLIASFSNHLEKQTLTAEELVTTLLHIADVSNPARPQKIATYWACAVEKEFLRQGDKEKKLGLEVSPFMDRNEANTAFMELRFIDYVVAPAFHALSDFLPLVNEFCVSRLDVNRKQWREHLETVEKYGKDSRRATTLRRKSEMANILMATPKARRISAGLKDVVDHGVGEENVPDLIGTGNEKGESELGYGMSIPGVASPREKRRSVFSD